MPVVTTYVNKERISTLYTCNCISTFLQRVRTYFGSTRVHNGTRFTSQHIHNFHSLLPCQKGDEDHLKVGVNAVFIAGVHNEGVDAALALVL